MTPISMGRDTPHTQPPALIWGFPEGGGDIPLPDTPFLSSRRARVRLGQRRSRHGDPRGAPWQAWQRPAPLPHRHPRPPGPPRAVTEPGVSPRSPPPCHPGERDGVTPRPPSWCYWWHGTNPPPTMLRPHRCCLSPPGRARGVPNPVSVPSLQGAAPGGWILSHPKPPPRAPQAGGGDWGGLAVGTPSPGWGPCCAARFAALGPARSLNVPKSVSCGVTWCARDPPGGAGICGGGG